MTRTPVYSIIGAGNSGFGLAADLGLRGFTVRLFDLPQFKGSLDPVAETGGIRIRGIRGEGFAPVALTTTEPADAIEGADVVFVVVPAYGQRAMARALAPHLGEGDVVVLLPGNMGGALEFAHVLREEDNDEPVIIAEGSSFIFACKKDGADGVWIRGLKQGLPVAALPSHDTPRVLERLNGVYPEMAPALNVLDTSLNNINHMSHPPAVLLNLGRIEFQGGDWSFFHEGMTPAVCRVMERIDEERLAVVGALGLPRVSLLEWTLRFYSHQGMSGSTLYEANSRTPVHGAARAPSSIDHRYFTEDVPFGLVPIASFARALGVPAPVTEGLIAVSSAACGRDFWSEGRTVDRLGLAGMSPRDITAYVEGSSPQRRG